MVVSLRYLSSAGSELGVRSTPKRNSTLRVDDAATSQSEEDSASVSSTSQRAGQFLDLSNTQNFLRVAQNATDTINSLRERQLGLAELASQTSNYDLLANYDEEAQEIETEISRVVASASYNGINTLQSSSSLTIPEEGFAVSLGISPNASSLSFDLSSQLSAESAVTSLEDKVIAGRLSSSNISSALEKADAFVAGAIDRTADQRSSDPTSISDISDAQELANQIANQLDSRFSSDQTIISSTLDSDRVSALLSED